MSKKHKKITQNNQNSLSGAVASVGISSVPSVRQTTTPNIAKIEEDLKKTIDEMSKGFDKRIEEKETKTTEILAIFITLFTFISVNISIFTKVNDLYTASWFLALMTTCSLMILSTMFLLISNRRNWYAIAILILSIVFMWGLLFATKYMPGWNVDLNSTQVAD